MWLQRFLHCSLGLVNGIAGRLCLVSSDCLFWTSIHTWLLPSTAPSSSTHSGPITKPLWVTATPPINFQVASSSAKRSPWHAGCQTQNNNQTLFHPTQNHKPPNKHQQPTSLCTPILRKRTGQKRTQGCFVSFHSSKDLEEYSQINHARCWGVTQLCYDPSFPFLCLQGPFTLFTVVVSDQHAELSWRDMPGFPTNSQMLRFTKQAPHIDLAATLTHWMFNVCWVDESDEFPSYSHTPDW